MAELARGVWLDLAAAASQSRNRLGSSKYAFHEA